MARRRRSNRWLPFLPWLLLPLAAVGLTALELRLKRPRRDDSSAGPEVAWVFEAPRAGAMVSSPLVADGRVYIGAVRDSGLSPGGTVYAVDEASGRGVWHFDDMGQMIHMYSSPCLAGGRLYIGEGMHANFECHLYCLDAADGRRLWRFAATSHIESTPCVAEGRVYFGAGDDGVYALDAETGRRLWQFNEARHVDSNPAVAGGLVYIGTGVSRRYRTTEVVALDAQTGRPAWRVPVDLPVWGAPVVDDGQILIGMGNGRLDRSDPRPAGRVMCLDARTGHPVWECPAPDDITARVACDRDRVYFGCRDGRVYAAARSDGRVLWQRDAGSPVVTAPALLGGRLYVVASAGRVVCLDAGTGDELASFDVASHSRAECRLYSSPAVRLDDEGRVRVYFGTDLRYGHRNAAALYCVRF